MIEHIAIPEERVRILKKDRKWEGELKNFVDAKIKLNEDIEVECDDSLKLIRIKEIFKAFGRGFDFDAALNLIDEEYFLEVLDVKHFSKKSRDRLITLKGRVIGKKGKAKNIIEKYTETEIVIYGKTISIIGRWKNVKIAAKAIEMLLSGAMHTSVYHFLEDKQKEIL
jgi:ribosomal RNA assembly protein